jgi:hypothetical protein
MHHKDMPPSMQVYFDDLQHDAKTEWALVLHKDKVTKEYCAGEVVHKGLSEMDRIELLAEMCATHADSVVGKGQGAGHLMMAMMAAYEYEGTKPENQKVYTTLALGLLQTIAMTWGDDGINQMISYLQDFNPQ